jgi:hypothetical protein
MFEGRPLHVTGWDQTFSYREEIRDDRPRPIRVELRHVIPGDIELTAEAARLVDFQTVEFTFEVPAGQKLAWQYQYVQHFGRNAKQDRIILR